MFWKIFGLTFAAAFGLVLSIGCASREKHVCVFNRGMALINSEDRELLPKADNPEEIYPILSQVHWTCSLTSVIEQVPLKRLGGFLQEIRPIYETCGGLTSVTTNRVVEQVQSTRIYAMF